MTNNKIDFEDCGAFVRIDGVRIPKMHILDWGARGGDGVFLTSLADALSAIRNSCNAYHVYKGTNAAEVLAALDEAMRGAR